MGACCPRTLACLTSPAGRRLPSRVCSRARQRAHRVFASLGLRHMVVVDQMSNQPVGIITRHDLQHSHWRPTQTLPWDADLAICSSNLATEVEKSVSSCAKGSVRQTAASRPSSARPPPGTEDPTSQPSGSLPWEITTHGVEMGAVSESHIAPDI